MITRVVCLASNVNTDLLRSQLDQLHSEAETTRRKEFFPANNARFRLLRLTEAAEKFRQQAARSLQMGKEDDARDLLLQKKKVMTALEKSKGRVELLDELAAKLNEAISIKEAQLIENIGSDLEFDRVDAESPVRIVCPMQENGQRVEDDNGTAVNSSDIDTEELILDGESQAKMLSDGKSEDKTVPECFSGGNEASMLSSLRWISSYIDLLENFDLQLYKIEEELVTLLEVSTLLLENQDKPNNSRVQQISEILESIRGTRARVQCFMQGTLKTR